VTVELPAQMVWVDADLTRFAQVLANVLSNAAKYSEPGGHIRLRAERDGSTLVVSVKDTGIGIAPEHLPGIFEMFSQVDRSLDKSQGGLGIGLALVKRLVELHGGTVEARSEGVGKGAELLLQLPIVVDAPAPRVADAQPGNASRGPLRILVVDDNVDGADLLAQMLEAMGNQTRVAYDGEQALAAVGEFRPDVVLLDLGLPKLNGYDVCRQIRAQDCARNVVVIAQTGWGQSEDRQRTRDAGFDHHLVKPIDPRALRALLDRVVRPDP
jgi:CheY-like chemotaxis protein